MPHNVPYLLYFDTIGLPDAGYITTTQYAENIPFPVKRVFWTYDTPAGTVRGLHANKQTEEVLIALKGSIRVEVDAGAGELTTFILDAPDRGLFLPAMCWTRIYFTTDAILLSLSSTDFEESDYIRDYKVFLKEARNKQAGS